MGQGTGSARDSGTLASRARGGIIAAGLAMMAAGGFLAPQTAAAQAVYAAYEHGTDDVDLLFAGVQIPLSGEFMGLSPFVTASGYRLSYERGLGEEVTVHAFTPAVGLRHGFPGGSVSGSVGYKFQDTEDDSPNPFFGGDEGGVSTSLNLYLTDISPVRFEALTSYNWGAEYFWSRGRATVPILPMVRAGGDLSWQGEIGQDDGYSAVQFGPVVQATFGRFSAGVRAGWKNTDGDDSANYFGVEVGMGF